ncbi:MAG: hypothetical protein IMW90_09905 [Thermogemmatispora sp.]|uniref:Glycoside hydrolase family 42 N-terminal domain-containing protein n=1 Tax=Thermogemmatispora aurantia TaxID=2045279 RepID=A0A5J4K507_9CHLR|nr:MULTISPECIES: hypothetical protein [Thermogemmatispora]MBE3566029.1 hypothetical protein [Thermogemmatispora sp.]GER82172.1 hypothetical protein KTAU_08100 [Thermogemmatispora aurantia]
MDITVAYFHSLFHPDLVKRDFEQIRAAGASSIVYSILDEERHYWPRDLERGLLLAQDVGLKVYLSPGQHGNLFATPSPAPSWYTFHHPESRVLDRHGRYHDLTCFNHEPFRRWLFQEIAFYLNTYPINGILLDEPDYGEITCFCSVCRALCPDVTDLAGFRRRSWVTFLSDLCAYIKGLDKHVRTVIVLPSYDASLIEDLALLPDLDMLGLHLQRRPRQQPQATEVVTGSYDRSEREIVDRARQHQKRSLLWLQNFDLDEEGQQELPQLFQLALHAEPDEVACYYYWRNNSDPEGVWQLTRQLLRSIPRRQLHWQTGKHFAIPRLGDE